MGRNIVLSVFLLSLLGCATTNSQTALNQLQSRVDELEQRLKQKDDEISALKYDLDQSSYSKPKKIETYSSSSRSSSSGSSSGKKNIIRVDASTQDVQEALKRAGYYSGNVDGKIGNKTKSAISDFQRDHGLKADGIVGRKTWEELQAAGIKSTSTVAASEIPAEEISSEQPIVND